MSTKRKINSKDINLLKINLYLMFKIKENEEYDITEDEYGFQINLNKSFVEMDKANQFLLFLSGLFCNFGFSSCGYEHKNTTHAEAEIKLEKNFKYLDELSVNNQYNVSETTIKTAKNILTFLKDSLNNEKNKKPFNDSGNVEVYSDSYKFIWIDVFVKSNKVSFVCKETSYTVVYPLAFNMHLDSDLSAINEFVSVICLAK